MPHSTSPMTVRDSSGRELPFVRPGVAISGSPFTVTGAADTTGAGDLDNAKGIMIHVTAGPIFILFSQDGTAADANDFRLESTSLGNPPYVFPVRVGDRLSMFSSGSATVYMHAIDE